ncbi:hypothetical protein D0Z07_4085 [Hyphodiscus hymeniophilus]|uniref:Uncharacterized protein n=1 Tax=Hyphodiscus hymeniophilus TaxID=353542 RepID=A0A9P6VK69_9HELO|nr:hypothetical protein D0Z07_4085 [Hyphodiscus hymeniophilus]
MDFSADSLPDPSGNVYLDMKQFANSLITKRKYMSEPAPNREVLIQSTRFVLRWLAPNWNFS